MAEKIQADYAALDQLSSRIFQQSDHLRNLEHKVRSQAGALQHSWSGAGAAEFQCEMDDLVLPALKRLAEAIESSLSTITVISSIMSDSEEEAVALLQAETETNESVGDKSGESNNTKHFTLKDKSVKLSKKVEKKVGEIAGAYHEKTGKELVITDGSRTAADQADRMYDKIIDGEDLSTVYSNAKALKPIQKAYDDGLAAKKSASEIKADMTKVIESQVKKGTYISDHLRAGAFDVRARGMSDEDKKYFKEIVKEKLGAEPGYETKPAKHFHVEIE